MTTVLRLLLIPLAIYTPGWAACTIWGRSLRRRLDFSESLFVHVLLSVLITSLVILVLAEVGCFTLAGCVLALALISAILAWLGWRRRDSEEEGCSAGWLSLPRPRVSWASLALASLMILAGWMYFRPAETFLVLDDGGVYALSGIHLAESGQLMAHDPILADFDPALGAELLFSSPWTMCWRRFWGPFYLLNWGRSSVAFGFLDFHRVWVALFVLAFGREGALCAAPAFGLLATAGLFFLARRVFDTGDGTKRSTWIGVLGASLLTISFPQVWNVRYPLSEATTQTLVISGLYLLSLLMNSASPLAAIACGTCFGCLLLTRLEAIPIVALAFCLLWAWRRESHSEPEPSTGGGLAILSLTAMSAYALMHNLVYARQYLNFQIDLFFGPELARLLATAGAVAIVIGVWLARRPEPILRLRQIIRRRPWKVARALTIGALALVVLFVLLWRVLWPPFAAQGDPRWSLLYWTPVGLVTSAAGIALFVYRRKERLALPFLAVSLLGVALYVMNPFIEPIQPWATRRLMPTVMPALALFSAYAVVHLPGLRFRLDRPARLAIVVALVALLLTNVAPLAQRTEFQGCLDELQGLASRFPPDALVLFNNHNPAWHVCQPLRYLFGLDVFVLQKETPDTEAIRPLLRQSWDSGKPVYLVLCGGTLTWYPPDMVMIPDSSVSMSLPRTRQAIDGIPSGVHSMTFKFDIYRLLPRDSAEGSAHVAPRRLEMVDGEYPYARSGLYGSETTPDGTTFRWTDGTTRLVLAAPPEGNLLLRARLSGGRKAGLQPPTLSAEVDGQAVGQTELDGSFGFRIVEYPLPPGIQERGSGGTSRAESPSTHPIEIELHSETWVPSLDSDGSDSRTLGVMLDWVEIVAADEQ